MERAARVFVQAFSHPPAMQAMNATPSGTLQTSGEPEGPAADTAPADTGRGGGSVVVDAVGYWEGPGPVSGARFLATNL